MVLKAFFLLLQKKGVKIAVSDAPKDVSQRYYKDDSSFKWVEDESDLYDAKDKCERNGYFMHLRIPPQNRGAIFDFIVVDIDSKLNGELAVDYNSFATNSSPFINTTPHGVHLFFNNYEKKKQRKRNVVLKMGILADILARGWITFYGKGYDLRCTEDPPSTIQKFSNRPPLLLESNSEKPFIVNQTLLKYPAGVGDEANMTYWQTHFKLNSEMLPQKKGDQLVVDETISFFSQKFPRNDLYGPTLLLLLEKWGMTFEDSSAEDQDSILWEEADTETVETKGGDETDSETDSEAESDGDVLENDNFLLLETDENDGEYPSDLDEEENFIIRQSSQYALAYLFK